MRIAIGIEYDGRSFCGWQSQAAGCGVQDAVERALTAIVGSPVAVTAAGRTDSKVHAAWQVAHFDSPVMRPANAWTRGVTTHLPEGVAIRWARPVADHFHARFDARERCYHYVLLNREVRPGLHAGRIGWYHVPLDEHRMRAAAQHLLGRNDFSAFRSVECQARSPVRELRALEIVRHQDTIVFELRADAFLHHMVRNIVGCLVYVGKGRNEPSWLMEVLNGRDRAQAAPTFAPDGLYLTDVCYPEEWNLPRPPKQFAPTVV